VSASITVESVFWLVSYCKWTHQIHTNHDPGIQCQILLFWVGAAHISFDYSHSLSFDILDKRNIKVNVQHLV
jgi:hypothetical protein